MHLLPDKIKMRHNGLNVTLIIQDEGWNKLATFKWNTGNRSKQNYVLKAIDDAFGIKLKKSSDMDWIKD